MLPWFEAQKYLDDYDPNPNVSFAPGHRRLITSGMIHEEFVRLLFILSNKHTQAFFEALGLGVDSSRDRGTCT
jgi:hypothetical protein